MARGGTEPLRALLLDQSWAAFIIDAEGVSMSNRENLQTRLHEEAEKQQKTWATRKNQEAGKIGKVRARVLEEVDTLMGFKFMRDHVDGGVYINWSDPDNHRLHDIIFIRNISESQASLIANKAGMKYWVHSKAFHEGRERYPLNLDDPPFFAVKRLKDIPNVELSEEEAEEADSDVKMALVWNNEMLSASKVRDLLQLEAFNNSAGLLVSFVVSPTLTRWITKRWPGMDWVEASIKFRDQLDAWDAAGWTAEEIMEQLGFHEVHHYIGGVVLRFLEETGENP